MEREATTTTKHKDRRSDVTPFRVYEVIWAGHAMLLLLQSQIEKYIYIYSSTGCEEKLNDITKVYNKNAKYQKWKSNFRRGMNNQIGIDKHKPQTYPYTFCLYYIFVVVAASSTTVSQMLSTLSWR